MFSKKFCSHFRKKFTKKRIVQQESSLDPFVFLLIVFLRSIYTWLMYLAVHERRMQREKGKRIESMMMMFSRLVDSDSIDDDNDDEVKSGRAA